MKPKPEEQLERGRLLGAAGDVNGAFRIGALRVIASDGGGWDHVSVSRSDRTPTWEEMELVKRLFFRPDEVAMQLHVAESRHINLHELCLHLWRPQTTDEIALIKLAWGDQWPRECPDKSPGTIPLPPTWMV